MPSLEELEAQAERLEILGMENKVLAEMLDVIEEKLNNIERELEKGNNE
jgi:hypothetical protein